MEFSQFVKRTLFVVGLALLLAGVWYFSSVVLLVFLALVIAVGISIPSRALQRRGLSRGWSTTIAAGGIFVTLGLLLSWLIPVFISEIGALISQIPDFLQAIIGWYADLRANSGFFSDTLPPLAGAGAELSSLTTAQAQNLLEAAFSEGVPGLVSTGSAVLTFLANFAIVMVMAIMLLIEPANYVKGILYLLPKKHHADAVAIIKSTYRTLRNWITSISLSIIITMSLTGIILGLIGVPNFGVVAIVAGLATFIPNIGAALPLIPIAIFTLSNNPALFLIAAPAYLAIQLVESNVLTPYIERQQLHLPVAALLAFQLLAGFAFGLIGVLLAVPIFAVSITLIREVYSYRLLGISPDTINAHINKAGDLVVDEE